MKPLHLGLIIAVSAIGGGLIMKVSQRSQAAPAPVVAEAQNPPATAPAEAPTPAAEPADASATGVPDTKPSPVEPPKRPREAPKPGRVRQPAPIEPAAPAPAPAANRYRGAGSFPASTRARGAGACDSAYAAAPSARAQQGDAERRDPASGAPC